MKQQLNLRTPHPHQRAQQKRQQGHSWKKPFARSLAEKLGKRKKCWL